MEGTAMGNIYALSRTAQVSAAGGPCDVPRRSVDIVDIFFPRPDHEPEQYAAHLERILRCPTGSRGRWPQGATVGTRTGFPVGAGGRTMNATEPPTGLAGPERAFLRVLLEATGRETVEAGRPLLLLAQRAGLSEAAAREVVARLLSGGLISRNQIDDSISVTFLGRELAGRGPGTGEQPEPYRIFISHNHEDEEVAIRLKDYLVELFGERVDIFISGDPRSNLAGNDLITTIITMIRRCDLMFILCTPESVVRRWVNFEAGAGEASAVDASEKRIVPVCFGGLVASQLPVLLNHRQAIDYADPEKFRKHFDVLFDQISERTGIWRVEANILESPFFALLRSLDP